MKTFVAHAFVSYLSGSGDFFQQRPVSTLQRGIRCVAALLVFLSFLSFTAIANGQVNQAEKSRINYSTREWNFRDTEIETWTRRLARFGLELPVELSGKVSGKLVAEIPWGAMLDAQAWRLRGSISSESLLVDGISLADVRLQLRYREGDLSLTDLNISLAAQPDAAADALGRLSGTATMKLSPLGDFTGQLEAEAIALQQFQKYLPETIPVEGLLFGTLTAKAAADQLQQLSAWDISGPVRIGELSLNDAAGINVVTNLQLKEGKLTAEQFTAKVDESTLTGSASLQLTGESAWRINAALETMSFSKLMQQVSLMIGRSELANFAQTVTAEIASGTFKASGPNLDSLDPITGRIALTNGAIELPSLGPLPFKKFGFSYQAPNLQLLQLNQISAELLNGTLMGDVSLFLGDQLGAKGELRFETLDVGNLALILLGEDIRVEGSVSGTIAYHAPQGTLNQPENWQVTANIRPADFQLTAPGAAGSSLSFRQGLQLSLSDGKLRAKDLDIAFDDATARGSIEVQIGAPWQFDSSLEINSLQASSLQWIPQLRPWRDRFAGIIDLSATLSGTLEPLEFNGNGRLSGEKLRWDDSEIDRVSTQFVLSDKQLQFRQLDARLYGGTLTGSLSVGLADRLDSTADLAWDSVDAGDWFAQFVTAPGSLSGTTTGTAKVRVPASEWGQLSDWEINASASVDKLTYKQVELAELQAEVHQESEMLTYQANGSVLGGKLDISGERDYRLPGEGLAVLGAIEASLRGLELQSVAKALSTPTSPLNSLSGSVNAELRSVHDSKGWSWQGKIQLPEARLKGREVVQGLTLQLAGNALRVRLQNLSGTVAGGRMTGQGNWNINDRRDRGFAVTVRRIKPESLWLLAGNRDAPPITGPLNLRLKTRIGNVWHGRGSLELVRGKVQGVSVSGLRLPVSVDWSPLSGRLHLRSTGSTARVAGGRIRGQLTARRSYGWNVDGEYRFSQVDVAQLLDELNGSASYGNGRLDGTVKLSGRNVRSLNDLQASLKGDLKNARAADFPAIPQIYRFVPSVGGGSATTFTKGRVEAQLKQGSVVIDQLSLASSKLKVFIDGRINPSGRLRLEAVIATGQFGNSRLTDSLLAQVVAVGVVPLSALQAANDFLSNRVIHLSIGGNLRQPILRPRPFKSLPREAIRFFLRRATGGLVGASAASSTAIE